MTENLNSSYEVDNKNLISTNNFRFQIKRLPTTNYFCQEVNVPGLSVNSIRLDNQVSRILLGGKKLEYNQLQVTFKVDEDMKNWEELFNWIVGISSPQDTDQYTNLVNSRVDKFSFGKDQHNIYSDGSVFLLTNTKNVNMVMNFINLQPVSLSDIQMTTTDNSELSSTAIFDYDYFELERRLN